MKTIYSAILWNFHTVWYEQPHVKLAKNGKGKSHGVVTRANSVLELHYTLHKNIVLNDNGASTFPAKT